MKTILLIISIIILGLYSCGDEVTNPTLTPEQETKKYTLEEILADSNWVEVIDTVNIQTSDFLGYTSLHRQWKDNSLKIVNSQSEYLSIETESDTNSSESIKNLKNWNIDFNQKSLIGFKTIVSSRDLLFRKLFLNIKLKQYQYFVIDSDPTRFLDNARAYNLLIVPKINYEFNIFGDYLFIKGYKQ